jgi:acyl-coenzyme A thioesterase PaaI-like protein
LTHHDLCFGCGQANLFGLQLERDRFFVKQDHQGPDGAAHPGIVVTALLEAMSQAGGDPHAVRVQLHGPAPVGEFVDIEATAERATASRDGEVIAECRA